MKFYHVERTDSVGYDEFDAWTVRAATAYDAVFVVWKDGLCFNRLTGEALASSSLGFPNTLEGFRARVNVTELPAEGGEAVILGSFNAG